MRLKYPTYIPNARKRFLFLILFICLAAGCAEPSQNRSADGSADFRDYLNQKTDVMTYEQAIEQWGSPKRVTQSIGFFVATWQGEARSPARVSIDTTRHGAPAIPGGTLQLTFEKETKKMVQWKYGE